MSIFAKMSSFWADRSIAHGALESFDTKQTPASFVAKHYSEESFDTKHNNLCFKHVSSSVEHYFKSFTFKRNINLGNLLYLCILFTCIYVYLTPSNNLGLLLQPRYSLSLYTITLHCIIVCIQLFSWNIIMYTPRINYSVGQPYCRNRIDILKGARKENGESTSSPALEIAPHVERGLNQFGITGFLSVSLSSTFVSIILSIWSLILMYKTTIKTRQKIMLIMISSLVLQITGFLSQIFALSFRDTQMPDLQPIVSHAITSLLDDDFPTIEVGIDKVRLEESKAGAMSMLSRVRQHFGDKAKFIPDIPNFPNEIFKDCSSAHSKDRAKFKARLVSECIAPIYASIDFWTFTTCTKWWGVSKPEKMLLSAAFSTFKTQCGFTSAPTDEEYDSKDPDKKGYIKDDYVDGKCVDNPLVLVERKRPNDDDIIVGAEKQFISDSVRKMCNIIAGVIVASIVAIVSACAGKTIDLATLTRNWTAYDFLTGKAEDIITVFKERSQGETAKEKMERVIGEHVAYFSEALEHPLQEYTTDRSLRESFFNKVIEVEKFLKVAVDPKLADKTILGTMFVQALALKNNISKALKVPELRVEPRVFVFYGEGGCSKTKLMQRQAWKVGEQLFPHTDPNKRIKNIPPRGKFWPHLAGEKIFEFDEIAGSVDFNEEVLLRDVRGICSSAPFEAPTAAVDAKEQFMEAEIILATTNTHPDDIMMSIANRSGAEAIAPCAQRMQFYKVERNVLKYGPVTTANRDTASYDKSGNFRHILIKRMKFDSATAKHVIDPMLISVDDVTEDIIKKHTALKIQHQTALREKAKTLSGAQAQAAHSRKHFVINFHGLPNTGKGRACDEVLSKLQQFTRYPIIKITPDVKIRDLTPYKRRQIVVIDDYLQVGFTGRQQQESDLMYLYNSLIPDGSIILFLTNIIPKTVFPNLQIIPDRYTLCGFKLPWFIVTAQPRRKLELHEPGLLRRLGFTGKFSHNNTHETDLCYYVADGVYYKQLKESENIIITKEVVIVVSSILVSLFFHFMVTVGVLLISVVVGLAKLNSLHGGIYDLAQLYGKIIEGYSTFLHVSESVHLIYGAADSQKQPTISVFCSEYSVLQNFSSPVSLANHVYQNFNNYQESSQNFKIFVNRNSASKLLNAIPRFISKFPEKNVDSIVKALQEMAIMLKGVGEECCAQIELTEVGKFTLDGNTIYCDCRCVEEVKSAFTMEQKYVTIWPLYDMSMQDLDEEWMLPQQLSWDSIMNFHLSGEKSSELTTCSLRKQDFLAKALHDPQLLSSKMYRAKLAQFRDARIKDRLVVEGHAFASKFKEFVSTTTGKVCLGLLAGLALLAASAKLYQMFYVKEEQPPLRLRHYSTDDTDDEVVTQRRKKPSTKAKRRPLSDVDNQKRKVTESRSAGELASDKILKAQKQSRLPHGGTTIPQSVKDLPDMNGYDEFRNVLQDVETKVSKNSCYVLIRDAVADKVAYDDSQVFEDDVLKSGRCYGLFIKGRTLVTVGHICDYIKGSRNLYVCSDEFGKNMYKATLVKTFSPVNRDLSIWTLENNEYAKYLPVFKDISKKFWPSFGEMEDYCTSIMKRYSQGKKEQFLYGTMWYEFDVSHSTDAEGNPFSIDKYGICCFSFTLLALTSYGDCGLPYYNVTNNNKVYIPGIHCMGNTRKSFSTGIVALVTQQDFKYIPETKISQVVNCPLCDETKDGYVVRLAPDKPEEGAIIVINSDHGAGPDSLFKEMTEHLSVYPKFLGRYRKSYGPLALGTQEHSHLHCTPNLFWTFDKTQTLDGKWKEEQCEDFGKVLVYRALRTNTTLFKKLFDSNPWIKQYSAYVNRCETQSRRDRKRIVFEIEVLVHAHTLTDEEKNKLLESPIKEINLETYFATPEQIEIVMKAKQHLREGVTNDIPIADHLHQNTVSLLGSFKSNKSRIPIPAYEPIAGFSQTKLAPGKVPFEIDPTVATKEEQERMEENTAGALCARVTQSVQWQGRKKGLPIIFRHEVKDEFKKGLGLYHHLRILSDRETLYGVSGLSGLELDKSIGFTLKSLFNVNLKSDVILLDEEGTYSWLDNPAAKYAKKHFSDSVNAIKQGRFPLNFYTELLKMEKLKPEKRYLGRIFCAADLNSTLFERKFMGDYVARACLQDNTIGVGANFWQIFNDMAMALREKDYWFTGDYKRWDKTVQEELFLILGECLDDLNTDKHYRLLLHGLANSIHVSGTTLFQKHIGMPSGSVLTATVNSKINDLGLYIVYVLLARMNGADDSYQKFNAMVYRKYYGDDVIIGVDKLISAWFNMRSVKHYLHTQLGFVLDSSEKNEGEVEEFMDWNELSWCSRYFRKLKKYNFFVGALKQSTIQSMLAWKKNHTDYVSLGMQITMAVFEAAAWDEEYYDTIRTAAYTIRKANPGVENWILILSYDEWQQEMYEEGLRARILRHVAEKLESGFATPEIEENFLKRNFIFAKNISKVECVPSLLVKMQAQNENAGQKTATMVLNEMHQAGKILKPQYDFVQKPDLSWLCQASTAKNGWCEKMITTMGIAQAKNEAKEIAAAALVDILALREQFSLHKSKKEMDVSAGDQVPMVQTSARDLSVSGGTNLYTNTQFAIGTTELNPFARAVNNIAQTGAPFDLKDSVYTIYREEQRTTVSASQGVGTTVFKISLDPKTRHAIQAAYINMHKAHIPSIDIGIFINGAAGAVGTLKVGFVTDASRDYTLDELQDIASCDVSLNQPSTVSYVLHDIRKGDMYRDVKDDSNTYPGIVCLVSNPITNVQKNDIVPFPINIYTRLNQAYLLANPSNPSSSTVVVGDLTMANYIPIGAYDIGIGKNIVCDTDLGTFSLDDCGWKTGLFAPIFSIKNIVAFATAHYNDSSSSVSNVGYKFTSADSATLANNVESLVGLGMPSSGSIISNLAFGFGDIPSDGFIKHTNVTTAKLAELYSSGTLATIPTAKITVGDTSYTTNSAIIFPGGIIILFSIDNVADINGAMSFSTSVYPIRTLAMRDGGRLHPLICYNDKPTNTVPTRVSCGTHYGVDNRNAIGRADFVIGAGTTSYTNSQFTVNWSFSDVMASFPFTQNALSTWTFLATGNLGTTSAAPTGMAELFFLRPGSSLNSNIAVNGPVSPGVNRLATVLEQTRKNMNAEWLAMAYSADGVTNDFELVFRNGVFLVRTLGENLIRLSLPSRTTFLKNLRAISNPNIINPFVGVNFSNWLVGTASGTTSKFANTNWLEGAEHQASFAANMAFSGISGLFGGLVNGMNTQQMIDLYLKQQGLQKWAKQGDWQNTLDLDNQRFNNNLQLRGMTSLSAGAGNASNATQPPPYRSTDNLVPPSNSDKDKKPDVYDATTSKQQEIHNTIRGINESLKPEFLPETDSIGGADDLWSVSSPSTLSAGSATNKKTFLDPNATPFYPPGMNPAAKPFYPPGLNPNAAAFSPSAIQAPSPADATPGPSVPRTHRASNTSTLSSTTNAGQDNKDVPTNRIWQMNPLYTGGKWTQPDIGSEVNTLSSYAGSSLGSLGKSSLGSLSSGATIPDVSNRISFNPNNYKLCTTPSIHSSDVSLSTSNGSTTSV